MTGTGSRASGHWRFSLLQRAGVLAGLAMLAACSGSPSTSSGSPPAGSSRYQQALAYAECMRSHGIANFPDPDSQGGFVIANQEVNGVSHGVDQSSPQYISASKTCQKLLPSRGQITPAQQRQQLSELLRLAACMRSHGIPNFPDPASSGGAETFNLDGLGIGDPARVQSLMQTCMKLTHFGQGAQ